MLSSFGFGNNKEQCCSVIIEICEGYNITQWQTQYYVIQPQISQKKVAENKTNMNKLMIQYSTAMYVLQYIALQLCVAGF